MITIKNINMVVMTVVVTTILGMVTVVIVMVYNEVTCSDDGESDYDDN